MVKYLYIAFCMIFGAALAFPANELASAVDGTVKKIDVDAKTMVVRTADGTQHTFHFTDRMAVNGAKETKKDTGEMLHSVKQGSEVVVHYSTNGATATADEIDLVGKGGMKTGEGTVRKIDRNGKILVLTGANGAEDTYRLTERAARDAGMDLEKGGEKSEKVTVYYSEEAGHKIAHFFKKAT